MQPSARFDTDRVRAALGDTARLELLVDGAPGSEVRVALVDPTPRWCRTGTTALTLDSTGAGRARVVCRPVRGEARAGSHTIVAELRSAGATATARAAVEVPSHRQLVGRVDPIDVDVGSDERTRLVLDNRGNVPETVTGIEVPDAPPGVRFHLAETDFVLGPGEERRIDLHVTARPTLHDGAGAFTVSVQVADHDVVRVPARYRRTATVTPRRLLAISLAIVLLAGALVVATRPDAPVDALGPSPCPAEGRVSGGFVQTFGDALRSGPRVATLRGHGFLATTDGCEPVRWDPCTPISYVVNGGLASDEQLADSHEAIRRLAAATGIEFVFEGGTDEVWAADRAPYQPERYGDRWAPLLLSWQDDTIAPREGGAVVVPGFGHPTAVDGVIVTAQLGFHPDTVVDRAGNRIPAGFGSGTTWGRVILHELGHAVGLGHVDDPGQLMHAELADQSATVAFQRGDRAGLRALGREAGCSSAPGPRTVGRP